MNRVILLGFFQKAQTSVICPLLFMLGTSVKFSKLLNSDIHGVPALNHLFPYAISNTNKYPWRRQFNLVSHLSGFTTLLKPFKDGRTMGKDL